MTFSVQLTCFQQNFSVDGYIPYFVMICTLPHSIFNSKWKHFDIMNVYLGWEIEAIWLESFQTSQQFWNEVVPQIILTHTILKVLRMSLRFCFAISVSERNDNLIAMLFLDAQGFYRVIHIKPGRRNEQ